MILISHNDMNNEPECGLEKSRCDRINASLRDLVKHLEEAKAASQRLEAELAAHAEQLCREIPELQPETAPDKPSWTCPAGQ